MFQRCGADVNNLQTGMKKLSGVITDAASGSASAAEKLAAVGLSIEDLNGKSQDEQPSLVISALQEMESGAERTSAATDLLGKSAVDMAAVLNMTAEDTAALKQEAEDYGMVMSNEAVAASAAFEDSLTRLQGTVGGLKDRMVGELLPGITQIMDGLSDLVAGNDEAGEEIKNGVTSVIESISSMIPQAVQLISTTAAAVLESAPSIISALAEGILEAAPALMPMVLQAATELIGVLASLLPQIISTGMQITVSLIQGIAQALPELIPQIVEVVVQIVQTLIDNLPMILDAALQLITGLAQGILAALLITGIIEAITGCIPQLVETGMALFVALIENLPAIIAVKAAEGLAKDINGVMGELAADMQAAIPNSIDVSAALTGLDGFGQPQTAQAFNVTIPLAIDGTTLARILAEIQWTQNAVYVRNLGTI